MKAQSQKQRVDEEPTKSVGPLTPPKPAFREFFQFAQLARKDRTKAAYALFKKYGNVVRLPVPGAYFVAYFHPDHVKYILKDNAKNYLKGFQFRELKRLLGEGLLTSEGELWRAQRRLISPEFQHQHVESFVPTMVKAAEDLLKIWRSSSEPRDIAEDMMSLTFTIAGQTMFGSKVDAYAAVVAKALVDASESALKRILSPIKIPKDLPTPNNIKGKRAIHQLNTIVDGIIQERRKNPGGDRPDLLSRLLRAQDPETGVHMGDKQVREEVMTLLLAGHETTSNALSWTFYLLAKNPEVFRELHAELDRVLCGRSPTHADLESLPFNRMVFLESMRLYPPAPGMSRTAVCDDVVGNYKVPAGSTVAAMTFVTQRHPDFWGKPDDFDPRRFLPEKMKTMHPFQYFPFGGGPRECVGKTFAMEEGQLLLATLAQGVSMELVESHPVVPQPLITLRPKYGIMARLKAR